MLQGFNILNDVKKGRICIANKHIKKGEIVLIETPFLIIDSIVMHTQNEIIKQLKSNINVLSKLMNLAPSTKYVNINKENMDYYLHDLILKIKTNAYSYNFGKSSALLYFGSFFNHSCNSNLTYRQIENQFIFTATKNIYLGEELCISYIYMSEKKYIERSYELSSWNFKCNCYKCKTEKLFEIKEKIDKYIKEFTVNEIIDELPFIYKLYFD